MSVLWPILKRAVQAPGRVALIDDQRRYTYGQLAGGAMYLADTIDAATAASQVGILLPTGGAFPMALLGAWLARRAAVPLNYLLSPDELTYVIRDSDIDTILTAGPMLDFLADSHRQAGRDRAQTHCIPPGIRVIQMEQLDFSGVPPLRWPPIYADHELAVILYTSGTSGRPKGVMLTHGNLHSNVDAAIRHADLTEADRFLGVLPQFHSFGITALTLLPLRLGATTVYSARFVPKKIVGLIRRHRPDVFVAVPSMYGALLTVKDISPSDFDSIRLAVSGGEPLPQATFDQYMDRLDLRLLEGYGLTETAPMTNWCTPHRHKTHSVGTALPGVTVITVDQHDRPLPPDEEGEILIAGPNVMSGYYKLPEQSQQVFVKLNPTPAVAGTADSTAHTNPAAQTFFRTGDIGRVDREGFLFITGRKKEMLIIAGENVFPREIEEVLNRHPIIRDSAVIGKSDGLRGQIPLAYVEIEENASEENASFDQATLRAWCRQHLAGYKVPREIRVIDHLPRSPTGKILRRDLKDV